MKKVFMIVHELDVNKGGMTTAMLTRSKVFMTTKLQETLLRLITNWTIQKLFRQ